MREILALAVTALLAAPAAAETYDCSATRSRADFRAALSELRSSRPAVYQVLERRRLDSPSGDSRSCTLSQWCLNHRAVVKLAAEGDTPVVVLQSAPPSSCAAPWTPLCETSGCRHQTEQVGARASSEGAIFVRTPDGQVRSTDPGRGRDGRPLAAQPWHLPPNPYGRDAHSPPNGVSFAWKGTVFTVQFLTHFIFRESSSAAHPGFGDTGATLDASVLEAMCRAKPYPCAAEEAKPCAEHGFRRQGRDFRDSRGGRWRDDAGGSCRPAGD